MNEPLCDLNAMLCPGAEAGDQAPPYLMIDLYPWDLDDPKTPQLDDPNWSRILSNPQIVAVCLKAFDGVSYSQPFVDWFVRNFKSVASIFGRRRGADRFVGGYHFLQAQVDGDAQATSYLATMWSAGWGLHDIKPIVDVEAGGPRTSNAKASRQQWIDNACKFVARVRGETGRGCMLYGRNVLADHNISTIFGCDGVWNPSYTRYMVTNGLVGKLPNGQQAACTIDDIGWWQCIGDGDGDSYAHHIPLVLLEIGKGVDLSVCIDGSRPVTMRRVRRTLL